MVSSTAMPCRWRTAQRRHDRWPLMRAAAAARDATLGSIALNDQPALLACSSAPRHSSCMASWIAAPAGGAYRSRRRGDHWPLMHDAAAALNAAPDSAGLKGQRALLAPSGAPHHSDCMASWRATPSGGAHRPRRRGDRWLLAHDPAAPHRQRLRRGQEGRHCSGHRPASAVPGAFAAPVSAFAAAQCKAVPSLPSFLCHASVAAMSGVARVPFRRCAGGHR